MTLKEFKSRFHVGMQVYHLRRTTGPTGHVLTVEKVQRNSVKYRCPDGKSAWMDFPKAANLVADEQGWTNRFPSADGSVFESVYLWNPPEPCDCEQPGTFNCGIPGIVGSVESPDTAERCDQCERFPSDEAARQELKRQIVEGSAAP